MKIVVLGAGQVGMTIVEALHSDHEMTVVDLDALLIAGALGLEGVRVAVRNRFG